MITYILRHGPTDDSTRYLVNGDPAKHVPLNSDGRKSASRARGTLTSPPVTWLTSEFPRAQQTIRLLMGESSSKLAIDRRLNELDYGRFEGGAFGEYAAWLERHGPGQRPSGAGESQREAIRRMLLGVLAALTHPGPRVLIAHGLLVSVLRWHDQRGGSEAIPTFFPEAPYLEPIAIPDGRLPVLIGSLLRDLEADGLP